MKLCIDCKHCINGGGSPTCALFPTDLVTGVYKAYCAVVRRDGYPGGCGRNAVLFEARDASPLAPTPPAPSGGDVATSKVTPGGLAFQVAQHLAPFLRDGPTAEVEACIRNCVEFYAGMVIAE